MTYLTTPYYGGKAASIAAFAALVSQARSSNTRIALIGDSQEDVIGDNFCDDLSQMCFGMLGKCNETVISQPYNYGTTPGVNPLGWCTNVSVQNAATKAVPDSYIPPGRTVISQTGYSYYNHRTMVNWKANNSDWLSRGLYTVIDPTDGYVAESFLYTYTGGSAACLWRHQKAAAPPGGFFDTAVANGTFAGTLNGTDWTPVKLSTPTLAHDPALPYDQVIIGHNVNSGLQLAGTRFIGQAAAGGIVWQSFAVGGYDTTDIASHADCGPMFKLMGGSSGWNAIAISISNNNAFSLDQTKAEYKSALSSLITTLRAWNDDSDTMIILLSDPPVTGTGWPTGAFTEFNLYEDAQYELSNELDNVVFLNSKRMMQDAGYDPSNATYSADGLHPTPLGAKLRANVIAKQMFNLEASQAEEVTVAAISIAQIIDGINNSALGTNAEIAAVESSKIPRAAAAVTAGAAVTRNIVGGEEIDEVIQGNA